MQCQALRATRWTTGGALTVSALLVRDLREVVTPTVRNSTELAGQGRQLTTPA